MPFPIGTESTAVKSRQRVFCAPQTAGGTLVYPTGSDPTDTTGGPLRVLDCNFGFSQARAKHGFSKAGTREFAGSTYSEMQDIPWTISARLTPPRNLAGTIMPELHHLLVGVFGARTITGGTSIAYSVATKSRGTLLSLARLVNEGDAIYGEWLRDCIPNKVTFNWQGGQPPTVTFEGKAAHHIGCGFTTLNGAVSSSTSLTISDAFSVDVGARIQIGSDTNSGSGYLVTAVDAAGTGLTVGTSLSASDGAEVRPYMPAATYSDQTPLGAVAGGYTLDGANFPMRSLELSIDNQTTYVEDEAGSVSLVDGIPGDQDVMGTMVVRATESELRRIISRKQFAASALSLAMGTGTTNRNHVLAAAQIEPDVENVELAEGGTASSARIPFRCLDSADGAADALTFTMS